MNVTHMKDYLRMRIDQASDLKNRARLEGNVAEELAHTHSMLAYTDVMAEIVRRAEFDKLREN